MTYGTSYFESLKAAIRYYRGYHYDDTHEAVQRKLADGEIHIGKPPLKAGESCYLDASEGRYFVETKAA